MTRNRKIGNIILVGMPGAGKSTLGVILAKAQGMGFVDTDVLIQQAEKRTLQEIIDSSGFIELRRIEERILLELDCSHHVIATGGSAVYSPEAMAHLKEHGTIIFLQVDFAEIQRRVPDFHSRGIARRPDQSFRDLFRERSVLYAKYADITVDCRNLAPAQICEQICKKFCKLPGF